MVALEKVRGVSGAAHARQPRTVGVAPKKAPEISIGRNFDVRHVENPVWENYLAQLRSVNRRYAAAETSGMLVCEYVRSDDLDAMLAAKYPKYTSGRPQDAIAIQRKFAKKVQSYVVDRQQFSRQTEFDSVLAERFGVLASQVDLPDYRPPVEAAVFEVGKDLSFFGAHEWGVNLSASDELDQERQGFYDHLDYDHGLDLSLMQHRGEPLHVSLIESDADMRLAPPATPLSVHPGVMPLEAPKVFGVQ